MAEAPRIDMIPQPLLHNEEDLVENVFHIPDDTVPVGIETDTIPDFASQDVMGEYLEQRMLGRPEPRTRLVWEATGRKMPSIVRRPDGYREVARWRTTDEWFIRPRTAVAIMVGTAALINGIGNIDTIEGAAKWAAHDVYRTFVPVEDTTKTITTVTQKPGEIIDLQIQGSVASTDVSGDHIMLNPQEIQSLGQKVRMLQAQDGKIISVQVTGNTSNDWGAKGDAAFGVPNVENQQLGVSVAQRAYDAAKPDLSAAGLGGLPVQFDQQETVLSKRLSGDLIADAKASGYDSLESAVKAVDQDRLTSGNLYQKIRTYITSKRGLTLSVKVQTPGKSIPVETKRTVTLPGTDHYPDVPKPKFYGFIPMIPLRRRERFPTMKQKHRWQWEPSAEIMRPRFIREKVDEAWLRIRPEAVKEDGSLVANSWAYTRKYEHLLRDDRIAEVLRADFKNPSDEDKSLRIMFIDEKPAAKTVETFSALLEKFAAMDGGKIADRVSAVFVYPSENAGIGHEDAKRIALGVDRQNHEHIQGTYTYILDLIEMHMPTDIDSDDLEQVLGEFEGPAWVLAHEAAGHATDDSDAPLRLRRVSTPGIPNAHVVDGNPRANKMKPLEKVLQKLPRKRSDKKEPAAFKVAYTTLDNNGQPVDIPAETVLENDTRLSHASHATIIGYQPTRYAGTSGAEDYAETAAAVTTGISVPFDEAYVQVEQRTANNGKKAVFATGYRPDIRGQNLFTRSVGAVSRSFPVAFKNQPAVTVSLTDAVDDPLLRQEMIRTKQLRVLTPRQMVAILARSTRSRRS